MYITQYLEINCYLYKVFCFKCEIYLMKPLYDTNLLINLATG